MATKRKSRKLPDGVKKLHAAGFKTMADVYAERDRSFRSAFDVLADVVGKDAAHAMLHELSVRQMFRGKK